MRPGGLFVNADHMPDEALPGLSQRLVARAGERREARYATGAVPTWRDRGDRAALDPVLAPLVEQRHRIYSEPHSGEWTPAASWHVTALRAAGFAEVGVVWRGGRGRRRNPPCMTVRGRAGPTPKTPLSRLGSGAPDP